jgi:hypothetical protein
MLTDPFCLQLGDITAAFTAANNSTNKANSNNSWGGTRVLLLQVRWRRRLPL